jgi:hypothetical protein
MANDIIPFAPKSLDEALTVSKQIATSALIPGDLRQKPQDVLVTILAGQELGLGPMQSIRGLYVVNGKPVMSSDMMVALCLRSSACEYFQLVESTPGRATYEAKRRGAPKPVQMSFTIEQARAAGLTGKGTWKSYPDAMLRARAASSLARAVFPDLVAGVYEPGEAEEFRRSDRARDVTPIPAAPVAPTVVPPEPPPIEDAEVVESVAQPAPDPSVESSVADELMAMIGSTDSRDTLKAVAPKIQQAKDGGFISDDELQILRQAYGERQAALKAGGK